MNERFILSNKNSEGAFIPDRVVDDPVRDLGDLEYGDAAEGEYQLWEHPSGKIFKVVPDRTVADSDYYSTPQTTAGEVWAPRLEEVGEDAVMVREAYERLQRE